MDKLREQFLDAPDLLPDFCVWCGDPRGNHKHEPAGHKLGASIRLCYTCHIIKVHGQRRLHFKYKNGWYGLEVTDGCSFEAALEMDGWELLERRWAMRSSS